MPRAVRVIEVCFLRCSGRDSQSPSDSQMVAATGETSRLISYVGVYLPHWAGNHPESLLWGRHREFISSMIVRTHMFLAISACTRSRTRSVPLSESRALSLPCRRGQMPKPETGTRAMLKLLALLVLTVVCRPHRRSSRLVALFSNDDLGTPT